MSGHILNTEKHIHIFPHIYIQSQLCATNGLYSVGCDSFIRKLMIPLNHGVWFFWGSNPTLLLPSHPPWLSYSWRLPQHYPVSVVDIQARLCVSSMCCATCRWCSPCQPVRWLLDAASQMLLWSLGCVLFARTPVPLHLVILGDTFKFFLITKMMSCLDSRTETHPYETA